MAALQSTAGLLTVQDVLEMELPEHWELIEGILTESPASSNRSSRIGLELGSVLLFEGQRLGQGWAFGADAGYILDTEQRTLVSPDASFVRRERLQKPDRGVFREFAPNFAIEVLSPSDRYTAAIRKAIRYIDAGTDLVWRVDPIRNSSTVLKQDAPTMTFTGDADLTAEPVLPNVRLSLSELFREQG